MKKLLTIICCLLFMPISSMTAYAAARLENLQVESSNIPENAVYLDMLVSMEKDDASYTPCNDDNMKAYSFDTKSIAEYNSEGFVSMSYHYSDVYTVMEIQRIGDGSNARASNAFTLTRISDGSLKQNSTIVFNLIEAKRKLRIAVLDASGNIIQVSEAFDITGKNGTLNKPVSYDIINNTLDLSYEHDGAPLYFVRTINPLYYLIVIAAAAALIIILISKKKKE